MSEGPIASDCDTASPDRFRVQPVARRNPATSPALAPGDDLPGGQARGDRHRAGQPGTAAVLPEPHQPDGRGRLARVGHPGRGVETEVWQFANVPGLAGRLEPPGTHDACYLPRRSDLYGPDRRPRDGLVWERPLDRQHVILLPVHPRRGPQLRPAWKPSFVTELAAEDRCHLNGLALVDDRPGYVTALGETDTREGWRPGKAAGGCVIEVASGSSVVRGLSMPHSPRVRDGVLFLLESGRGRLVRADRARGVVEPVAEVPAIPAAWRSQGTWRSSASRSSARPPVGHDLRQPADLRADHPDVLRHLGRGPGHRPGGRSPGVPRGHRRDLRCPAAAECAQPLGLRAPSPGRRSHADLGRPRAEGLVSVCPERRPFTEVGCSPR